MKTIPNLAEEIEIARNLFLLEYTGGKLHIPTISTENSVKLIKDAKANGLKVTCSASVHHLLLTDDLLSEFDTNYKITPPLRTEKDRKSLIDAVLDNTIDMITADHHPVDIEHKFLEFNLAKYGTIGLETAFPALNTVLPIENIVNKFTKSKNVFGIKSRSIAVGQKADLTMFVSDGDWVFQEKHIFSKSKNSAFLGQKMKGHVVGIINNNQLVLN
jgi:dihydroorotase